MPSPDPPRPTTVEAATGSDLGTPSPAAAYPETSEAAIAYERGKADARAADTAAARERELERERRTTPRRRGGGGGGLIGAIVLLLAIVGGLFLFLSWKNGSFAGGGAAVSHGVASVTQPAQDAAANLRNTTGQAVENAGQALQKSGEKIKQP